MVSSTGPTVGERLAAALDELGIERAHFVGAWLSSAPIVGLDAIRPQAIASVSLLTPMGVPASFYQRHEGRLVTIWSASADRDLAVGREIVDGLSEARTLDLPADYEMLLWTDAGSDHAGLLAGEVMSLADRIEIEDSLEAPVLERGGRTDSGITFRVDGSGTPIVFLPLGLAPHQWDRLVPLVSESHSMVRLGGKYLGSAAIQHVRLASPIYGTVIERLFEHLELEPGERVLEVGVGAGAIASKLAARTNRQNPIVGLDFSPYLLGEAQEFIESQGLEDVIELREGDALSLPFEDGAFDASYSATVFEEVNADAAIAELARVTKPGGRAGVVIRSNDLPQVWELDLSPDILAQINQPPEGPVAAGGCVDSSLYRRMEAAGLLQVETFPTWGTERPPNFALPIIEARSRLSAADRELFERALEQGTADRTAYVSVPFHCSVGVKPR